MAITLKQVELRKVDIVTRMPFRYGIATLTEVPYLLVFADFEVDEQIVRGVAADVLPPKWFTKQPEALLEDEIAEMLKVIRIASNSALQLGSQENVFRWWQALYQKQMGNEALKGLPPLLKGFGVSLLERAAIDATCRRHEATFHSAVRSNLLGISLEDLHAELAGCNPAQLLPETPQPKMHVRHTVGLADPLLDSEIAEADRLDDGLPQSLQACIQEYGLIYFKIKVPANIGPARARLSSIARLLQPIEGARFTLDGNEFFENPEEFRHFWEELCQDTQLKEFFRGRLLAVEQPLHRDVALSQKTSQVFNAWPDHPPLIIDESDAEISSLRQALETGYVGTSHKNCKGVFRGLANTCLINHRNAKNDNLSLICTGEDLMNLGPVALLQDLAVGATIGLTHMERNGHHFVAGLQPMPEKVQQKIQSHHADLYREHETNGNRFPSLAIHQGAITLDSVNQAPFGYGFDLDADQFEWIESF